MKLSVEVEISQNENTFHIDLEDLGISDEQWESYDLEKQKEILYEYINDNLDMPSWLVESIEKI